MAGRRRVVIALAMAVALAVPTAAIGQPSDPLQVALAHLRDTAGADFDVAYEAHYTTAVSGRGIWAGKFIDPAMGIVRAIYVDGPVHEFADRQERDARIEESMVDRGYLVIRFKEYEDWGAKVSKHPSIFGSGK